MTTANGIAESGSLLARNELVIPGTVYAVQPSDTLADIAEKFSPLGGAVLGCFIRSSMTNSILIRSRVGPFRAVRGSRSGPTGESRPMKALSGCGRTSHHKGSPGPGRA